MPGVRRAGEPFQLARTGLERFTAVDRRAVPRHIGLGTAVGHADLAVGVTDRGTQAPAIADRMVGAGKYTARVLTHLGHVLVAFLGLPVSDELGPSGLGVRRRQGGRGQRPARLRSGSARPHTRAKIVAKARERQRTRSLRSHLEAGSHARVRFAGEVIEHPGRRAFR
ncbi:hypothetical protein D3C87_1646330 [compost metagenome]